jgi:hypothetical protein
MTVISKCYICNKNISAKHSYGEHIILNALGGNLTSESLMCRPCAVSLEKIDAALAQSLNSFGVLLGITRDRKTNPPILVTMIDTGEQIYLESGGKPVLPEKSIIIKDNLDNSEQPFLYIKAKDEAQLREALKGKKRKYPFLNVEEIVKSAVSQQMHISPVRIEILFGDKQLRSVCKMAMNFYMYHNGKRDLITHLIPYIKGECKKNQYVNYYYPDELIVTSDLNESFIHTLFIKGNPQEKILYGYIELYNTFRLIVLLSDSYEESFFQEAYSFDVISREKVDKEININLTRKEILDLVNNSEPPVEKIAIAVKDLKNAIASYMRYKQLVNDLKNILQEANFDEKMSQELIAKNLSKGMCDLMYRGLDFHQPNFDKNY